jgi:hypothetical protein
MEYLTTYVGSQQMRNDRLAVTTQLRGTQSKGLFNTTLYTKDGYAMPQFPGAADATQNNWRFCNKCYSLWWNGMPDNGHCPGGGAHSGSGSWDFYLAADPQNPI